jgi:hypothetical protein
LALCFDALRKLLVMQVAVGILLVRGVLLTGF